MNFISVKNRQGKYTHFKVPHEIRTYIIQLEMYIHNPKTSKLLELYPERFKNRGG